MVFAFAVVVATGLATAAVVGGVRTVRRVRIGPRFAFAAALAALIAAAFPLLIDGAGGKVLNR